MDNIKYNHLYSKLTNIKNKENETNFLYSLNFIKNAKTLINILNLFGNDIYILEGFQCKKFSKNKYKNSFKYCRFQCKKDKKELNNIIEKVKNKKEVKNCYIEKKIDIILILN